MSEELSQDEIQIAPTKKDTSELAIHKRQIVLGLLVFAHAAAGGYLLSTLQYYHVREEYIIGIVFSQSFLFALWTAFSEQRFFHRFLWSCFLCLFISFIIELGDIWSSNRHFTGVIMISELTAYFALIPVFSAMRRFIHWRIVAIDDRERKDSDYRSRQFGIKHLLYLTTITALGFSLFRSLLALDSKSADLLPVARYIGVALILLLTVTPIFAIPWLILAMRESLYRRTVISVIMFVVLEILLCSFSQYFHPSPRDIQGLFIVQFSAGLTIFVTMLPLRFCGYRMIRVKKGKPSA